MRSSRRVISVVAACLVGTACGYAVEPTGNQLDLQLAELDDGETFTFAELTDTNCAEVGIVEAYAPDSERDRVVGRAEVSMEGQGQFVLVAVFDLDGERLLAARLSRTPYDVNDLGSGRIDCQTPLIASNGVVERR